VQEAWLRLSRTDTSDVENLGAWLTTVVARVCLNILQSRRSRREEPLDTFVPDPVVSRDDEVGPEDQALLADSVGLALLVVLETPLLRPNGSPSCCTTCSTCPSTRSPDRGTFTGGGSAAGEPRPSPCQGSGSRPRPRPPPSTRGRRCLSRGHPLRRFRRP